MRCELTPPVLVGCPRSRIVNLIEIVRDSDKIYIVQECLGGGELFEQLLAKGPFGEDYALTIFAQVAIAVDFMHDLDVVHRDLKAENIVFANKGSPIIKFIDFGGACFCDKGGLTGLVGTPQYVAPEVVTGFGENNPTNEPYGKGCDLWSIGVLLYVMLSKTMPFRAKEVDQLLKQVVRAKLNFKPEEKWKHISKDAMDLISSLVNKDVSKRLTIKDVIKHPWCADAIRRALETMPKMGAGESSTKEESKPESKKVGTLFKPMLQRIASGATNAFNKQTVEIVGRQKNKGVSREQQYWYAMEISPPSNMVQQGGVKLGEDGTIQMDGSVPAEMRAMLEEIQKAKAAKGGPGAPPSPAPGGAAFARINSATSGPPPSAPPPPPGGGGMPPPPAGGPPAPVDLSDPSASAAMVRLATENEAAMHVKGSDTMDTMLLMSAKDSEIAELKDELLRVRAELKALKVSPTPQKPASPSPPPRDANPAETSEAARAAEARADKAEHELAENKQAFNKLQAKLNAVSTLYTEAAQREAVLRLQLEQSGGGATPSYE